MNQKLPGICFIGCGKIAHVHAANLRKIYKGIQLSFYDTSRQKSLDLKSKFNGINAFPELAHALDSKSVDIVFITTPHAFHADVAVEAARCGKHLIIEKPVARNMNELKRIQAAVARYGVRCTVAENYMYKKFITRISESVQKGLIGRPLFVEINKYNRDAVSGWRTDAELMGGGALLEGGVHWVNLLVSIGGSNPVSVIAQKPQVDYPTNIPFEDSIMLMVNFENGMVGKLFHSWRIPNRFKGVGLSKVYGSEGVITFESNGMFTSVYGKKKKFYLTDFGDFLGYKKMSRAFVEDFCSGRPWNPGLERIAMEFRLIDAAYRSLKTGKLERI